MDAFGGEKVYEVSKIRDEVKNKYCLDNNIQLLRIKYTENCLEILNNYSFTINQQKLF